MTGYFSEGEGWGLETYGGLRYPIMTSIPTEPESESESESDLLKKVFAVGVAAKINATSDKVLLFHKPQLFLFLSYEQQM